VAHRNTGGAVHCINGGHIRVSPFAIELPVNHDHIAGLMGR
jgi:hypothetical protein